MIYSDCDIYGCRQQAPQEPTVTVEVNGVTEQIEVCDDHRAFFDATTPDRYAIGRTFTGEIEVRPIPAQPHAPRPPDPAPE